MMDRNHGECNNTPVSVKDCCKAMIRGDKEGILHLSPKALEGTLADTDSLRLRCFNGLLATGVISAHSTFINSAGEPTFAAGELL